MSFLDSAVISGALAANPALRQNLRELVQRLASEPFTEVELAAVERELVKALRFKDALVLPSVLPPANQPLRLGKSQILIVSQTIERFRDRALREKVVAAYGSAVSAGRVVQS